MRYSKYLLIIIAIILFNCDKDDPTNIPSENYLGGETDITLGQVGNTFTCNINIAQTNYDLDEELTIIENQEGVVKANFKADLSQVPELAALQNIAPEEFLDSQGKIDFDLKFKITSNGIQDYNNDDGYAHTLIDYNSVVGSSYSIRHSDGAVHTRTVTQKSTEDDFYWGGWMIKTMTVEQNAPVPGVSKYIIKANHRFGLVYFEMQMEDGTSISTPIFPAYY